MWYKIIVMSFLCLLISGLSNCPLKTQKHSIPIIGDNEKKLPTWKIYFECDESEITDESKEKLLEVTEFLQNNPNKTIKITGYTNKCCIANEYKRKKYNIALGKKRADSAKLFITGCDKSLKNRIYTRSKGDLELEVIGDDEKAWSKNRRAIISVN